MTETEIFASLQAMVNDIKGEDLQLKMDTALIGGDILDSLEVLNYLTQIEEKFGINISLDQLQDEELGFMNKMVKFLSNKL